MPSSSTRPGASSGTATADRPCDASIASAIEVRYRSRFGDNLETLESIDHRLLGFFREGGEMSKQNEEWGRIEEMLKSYPQVEHLDEATEDPQRPLG